MTDFSPLDHSDSLARLKPAVTRLLVVDDDPIQRRVIGRLAGQAGHEVVEAATVSTVEHLLESQKFDCVTVDLGLSDGNGADVLHIVAEKCPAARIMLVTGASGPPVEATRKVAEANGLYIHDVFLKPLDLAALRASFVRAREDLWFKGQAA